MSEKNPNEEFEGVYKKRKKKKEKKEKDQVPFSANNETFHTGLSSFAFLYLLA